MTAHSAGTRSSIAEPVMCTASPSTIDPLDAFAEACRTGENATYWERPDDGFAFAAIGAAAELAVCGPDRFSAAVEWLKTIAGHGGDHAGTTWPDPSRPLIVAGFSFDHLVGESSPWHDFGAANLTVPRTAVVRTACASWRQTNIGAGSVDRRGAGNGLRRLSSEPPADRSRASWERLVERAVAAIDTGPLEKVVLARTMTASSPLTATPERCIAALRNAFPHCAIFAVRRGPRTFVGASPERLVRCRVGEIEVSALAGTARRGDDDEDDARIGEAFLANAKDRHEHAIVVRMLVGSLRHLCDRLDWPTTPELLRMRNAQHLHTPIRGSLRVGNGILDVVAALHPTPAVGGWPADEARAFIAENEGIDRGWYASPVGWMSGPDAGEFVVGLRSALLHDNGTAQLFAGNGIVADSDPGAEYEETRLKLRPMLEALGVTE